MRVPALTPILPSPTVKCSYTGAMSEYSGTSAGRDGSGVDAGVGVMSDSGEDPGRGI